MHDVYIVINRGEELKEKSPPSISLCVGVSEMGIVADGLSCYLAHYNVASCKYAHQLKTKTTTSYGSATLNEKGMVPKDKGWGMSNLGYEGKIHVLPSC